MRHGRPDKQWYEFCGKQYHLCRSSDGLGWRRQHAATVWNAMAAVVAVAAAFEVGYRMLDKSVSDAKMRELIARCNWKESKPQ